MLFQQVYSRGIDVVGSGAYPDAIYLTGLQEDGGFFQVGLLFLQADSGEISAKKSQFNTPLCMAEPAKPLTSDGWYFGRSRGFLGIGYSKLVAEHATVRATLLGYENRYVIMLRFHLIALQPLRLPG